MKKVLWAVGGILIVGIVLGFFWYQENKPYYTAKDFGIETVKSQVDYNGNGVDDYTDILKGAKEEAKRKPVYKSAYYVGGYPPDTEGVCTDVIWRALKNAGYLLKDLVDEDIREHIELYPRTGGIQDTNIDFRRVANLQVYFERHVQKLTNDITQIAEWQPGDVVVFGDSHIGIISDKRNQKGIPYLIHNAAQPMREEDALALWNKEEPITGHYRINWKKEGTSVSSFFQFCSSKLMDFT